MYIITNTAEIITVIDNKAPRDVETILREIYPGCTIDANGRAHSPCDGYVCELTGEIYRGGEYLPETDEAMRGGSLSRMFAVESSTGKEIIFEGTKAQISAAREIAKRQQADFDATTDFIGEVKNRQNFELRICAIFSEVGVYGSEHTHYMRDENMNPIVYKGSKIIGKTGTTVKVKATVKSHWLSKYDNRKATYIARPANKITATRKEA